MMTHWCVLKKERNSLGASQNSEEAKVPLWLQLARQRLGVRQPSAVVRSLCALSQSARGLAQSKSFASLLPQHDSLVSRKFGTNCFLTMIISIVLFVLGGTNRAQALSAGNFLPADYVKDGSVSYQQELQRAIDAAGKSGETLDFPAMTYAVDETGLRLHSGLTVRMEGAVFRLGVGCKADGAVFVGKDVTDVTLIGGTIIGQNAVWGDGINIRGVYITGKSARIRIRDMAMRDLSSNGIGIFGEDSAPIRDVWIQDVIIENCCNRYRDYLSKEKGEKGSTREDQGLIACYFVEDFFVGGCRLERSRSDGTHFYRCTRGQFIGNKVYAAKMGGYFIETSDDVVATGNLLIENGSRGATIERGSKRSVFSGNTVSLSGREGLWAPDCVGLVIADNIFDRNGRKANGPTKRYTWNSNITVNEAYGDKSGSPTADYLITGNVIYSTTNQIAAIRVDANETVSGIVIRNNLLRGENGTIMLEGPRQAEAVLGDNEGAAVTHSPNP